MQGADADIYKLAAPEFRRHIGTIAQRLRSRPITAPELLAEPPVENPVLLTFDDGGVSAVTYVADLLDVLGWKAHFLITTSRITTRGFLDRTQIRELHQRGHVIGSHSYSHPPRMSLCSTAELDEEWRRSVTSLTDIIGQEVQVASVPGGFYSRRVASSAARCGIRFLFNSEPVVSTRSVDGCLVLGRFTVRRGHSPSWSAAISAGTRRPQIRQYICWNCKKVVKLLGGKVWLCARIYFFGLFAWISARTGSDSQT